MKRLIALTLAMLVVAAGMAMAQEKEKAEEKPPSPLKVYMNDRSTGKFLEALKSYEAARADSLDMQATIMISYLHLFELERNLEMLEDHAADLSNMNKFQYANILLDIGDYEEAIALYEQLNENTPKWSCPWRHRGEAFWKLKQYDEAVASLEKAIETRETHFDAYMMLAQVLHDMEEYERAYDVMKKGMAFYGKDIEDPEKEVDMVETYFFYLDLCEHFGDEETYNEIYEKLKERVPDDERLKK